MHRYFHSDCFFFFFVTKLHLRVFACSTNFCLTFQIHWILRALLLGIFTLFDYRVLVDRILNPILICWFSESNISSRFVWISAEHGITLLKKKTTKKTYADWRPWKAKIKFEQRTENVSEKLFCFKLRGKLEKMKNIIWKMRHWLPK